MSSNFDLVSMSFGSAILLIALLIVPIIIVILTSWRARAKDRNHLLPPLSSISLWNYVKISSNDKGLAKVTLPYVLSQEFREGVWGSCKYGCVFRVQTLAALWSHWIIITDFEHARYVLSLAEAEKPPTMKPLNLLDRETFNLVTHLTSNTNREKARKALVIAFSTSFLNKSLFVIKEYLFFSLKTIRDTSTAGITHNVKHLMLEIMITLLGKSAFGIDMSFDGSETDSTINGRELLELFEFLTRQRVQEVVNPLRSYFFWDKNVRHMKSASKRLTEVCDKVMRLYRTNKANDPSLSGRTLMADLLDAHEYPSSVAKLSEVAALIFAGHDTTAFTLCFFLMEISRHPDVKMKLQEELATVMPLHSLQAKLDGLPSSSSSAESTHDDIKLQSAIAGLEYFSWCINEIMRLWPVAANGPVRMMMADVKLPNSDILLPKGSFVNTNLYSIMRSPWIDRPDEFIPERWASSNPQLPALKEMLIPFSHGKRSCIGMNLAKFQLRYVAANLVHYFDFELVGEPTFEYFLTFKPDELMMKFKERQL